MIDGEFPSIIMLSFIYYKNIERGENMNKPKDLEEVREAVQNFLKEKYGDAVLTKSGGGSKEVVILTETPFAGNNDVWINFNYFH